MKKLFAIIALAVVTLSASGQKAGLYALVFSNSVSATSTNLYTSRWAAQDLTSEPSGIQHPACIISVSEFENAGLTCTVAPAVSGTGTVTFSFCKSFDGGVIFEDNPSIRKSVTISGLTATHVAESIDTTSVTHLALYSIENAANVNITNATILLNLKSQKRGIRYSVQ